MVGPLLVRHHRAQQRLQAEPPDGLRYDPTAHQDVGAVAKHLTNLSARAQTMTGTGARTRLPNLLAVLVGENIGAGAIRAMDDLQGRVRTGQADLAGAPNRTSNHLRQCRLRHGRRFRSTDGAGERLDH